MKKVLSALLLFTFITTMIMAEVGGDDKIIWTNSNQQSRKLDFTPNDKYIIAWTNEIQIWNTSNGKIEFSIPTEVLGDFNYNEEYLVFAQDSTPKLLDWKTKELLEGFEKEETFLGKIRTAKSKNEFMATKGDYPKVIYFWDINQKQILDSFEIIKEFESNGQTWGRSIHEYDYVGNNDEYFYVRINDNNALTPGLNPKNEVDNFSYLIYNRETKELVDSLFAFQITTSNFNHVDKLVVMNNRNNLAWNNKNSQIQIYNVNSHSFNSRIELTFENEVDEIIFSNYNNVFYVSRPSPSKYLELYSYNTTTLEKQFIFLKHIISNKVAFNSNNSLIAFSGIDSLGLDIIGIINNDNQSNINSEYKSVLNLFPNPTSSIVNIDLNCSEPVVDYQITDINGAKVSQSTKANQNGNLQIDLSSYYAGVYFLTINCNEPMTYKIIKE